MTKTAVVILRRPAKQKQQARHRALSLRETDSGRECANLKQNKLCFSFYAQWTSVESYAEEDEEEV